MNITEGTIPQLFYDFIARVIPGFAFLGLLNFGFAELHSGSGITPFSIGDNWISSFFEGGSYLVICYLAGWALSALIFWSMEREMESVVRKERGISNDVDLRERLDEMRARNENVGFRIVKLRAEARMLESLRCSMIFTIGIYLLGLLAQTVGSGGSANWWWFGCFSAILLLLAFAFGRVEKRAWKRYWKSIDVHYKIVSRLAQEEGSQA